MLPNLFIPGAGKSGTSSLHEYLNQHPDIFMSPVKEPHFFCNDIHYFDKKAREKYLALFKDGNNFKYRGESSTGYMVFPNVIERIKNEIANPKFLFILRNPIDRCYSHYNWVRSFGAEKNSFLNAVKEDMNEEPSPYNGFGRGYKYYFQFGLYGKWLKRYYDNFPESDIYIITFEEFKNNYKNILKEIFYFLNLKELDELPLIKSNVTIYYDDKIKLIAHLKDLLNNKLLKMVKQYIPKELRRYYVESIFNLIKKNSRTSRQEMKIEDRTLLKELYWKDIENLKKITGMKFEEWKDFQS